MWKSYKIQDVASINSFIVIQPWLFVYVLYMAAFRLSWRVDYLQKRQYGSQSLKYLLSCPLHINFTYLHSSYVKIHTM